MVVSVVNDAYFHGLPRIGERKTCDVGLVSALAGTAPGMLGRPEVVSLFRNDAPAGADQLNIHVHRLHELMRPRLTRDIKTVGCLMRLETHDGA